MVLCFKLYSTQDDTSSNIASAARRQGISVVIDRMIEEDKLTVNESKMIFRFFVVHFVYDKDIVESLTKYTPPSNIHEEIGERWTSLIHWKGTKFSDHNICLETSFIGPSL